METSPSNVCPQCGKPLTDNAVLCVNCGFHLKLGLHLATIDDSDAPPASDPRQDDNPYASPQTESAAPRRRGGKAVLDLTEEGAIQAEKVASAGEAVTTVGLIAFCLCPFVWFILLPWSAIRLFGWYQLHSKFEELRHPNSLSPHVEVALRFQAAQSKLWAAVVVSFVFSLLFGGSIVINVLRS